MKNKLLSVAIMATLTVILLGSLLVPIIDDYENKNVHTYTNSGVRASFMDVQDAHSITISGGTLTIDGTTTSVPSYQIALASDKFNARFYTDGFSVNCTQGAFGSMDVTIEEGKFSGTIGTKTYTDEPLTYLAVPDSEGEFVMTYADTYDRSIYLNDPAQQFYSANWITTTSQWFSYYQGTLTVAGTENDTMSFNGTQVDADTEVYKYTSAGDITFIVDNSGTDYTVHPFVCVVPRTVTGMTLSADHAVIPLLYAIPVLVIVALLLAAVKMIVVRND